MKDKKWVQVESRKKKKTDVKAVVLELLTEKGNCERREISEIDIDKRPDGGKKAERGGQRIEGETQEEGKEKKQ